MDYEKLSDEELVALAKEGNEQTMEILIKRCKYIVLGLSRSYFLSGGDTEDIIQEGMIGVFRAVMTFNGRSSFKSYAYLCIKSSIISLIKKSTRQKNKPLNNYISLSDYYDIDMTKTDVFLDEKFQPEQECIDNESVNELKEKISKILSALENKILHYYLQGCSYEEISQLVNKDIKSIDNAIQRIRKKILTKIAEN